MKTKFTLVLLVFSISVFAKEVTLEKAKEAAEYFLNANNQSVLKGISTFELNYFRFDKGLIFQNSLKTSTTDSELIYIFNINTDDGFIIVSGDDRAVPILGYSSKNSFTSNNIPQNLKKWLEGYKNQIRDIINNSEKDNPNKLWIELFSGNYASTLKSTISVDPLITTQWNQSPYVNDLCPYDSNAGERTVTGCAATAMAQIMKFWDYPEIGSGFHSYNHDVYGTISANFGGESYDWANMTNTVNSSNDAVATLMYHCGVSIDMSYGISSEGGSGAYLLIDHSPVEHCVEYALTTYFNYDNTVQGVFRSNYTTPDWKNLLKNELDAGRPIEYAGFGSGGGHAFVCDGYDANDFFHFNWGWGGYHDGFFAIDALDPSGTGIGGGSGGYNSGHQAIIGIKPPDELIIFDLQLYDNLTISSNPLFFSGAFNIHTDIANYGNIIFTGDFSVAIFDEDLNFVEFAEILEAETLEGGMHYAEGLDFVNSGSLNMLPGIYYAAVVYRPTGGNWIFAEDGSYTNFLEFEVYYSNDIELYSDMKISSGNEITQEEEFSVALDILNDGTTTFTGSFEIALFDMEGNFGTTVEILTGASLDAGYFYDNVEFVSSGISVDPGTYLMALLHQPDGGDQILTGSSYYTNPIKVVVKRAPLEADIYEDNDEEETAFELPIIFTSNSADAPTIGSNVHIGTDVDHYRINLEPGFNYTINARIHDSYNSGNQEVYSVDMLWAFNAHGYWSEVYDDVMTGSIEVLDGGEILFAAAPFFEGETGSYLLDIEVSRTEIVSYEKYLLEEVMVYPNPTRDKIYITSNEQLINLRLYDANGRLLISKDEVNQDSSIDVTEFTEGTYFLHILQISSSTIHKIIKQ